jgi:hypothetical protein
VTLPAGDAGRVEAALAAFARALLPLTAMTLACRLSLPGVQTLRILKVDRANPAADLPTGEISRNEVNPTVTARGPRLIRWVLKRVPAQCYRILGRKAGLHARRAGRLREAISEKGRTRNCFNTSAPAALNTLWPE